MLIRSASQADLGALARLNEAVQRVHIQLEPKLFRSDFQRHEVEAFFQHVLRDPDSTVLLAEHDGVIGYVWAEHQRRPATAFSPNRERLYVHHISVSEAARRKGVGSALLGAVERLASKAGVSRIVLDAWASNDSAIQFFSSEGYSTFNLVMARDL